MGCCADFKPTGSVSLIGRNLFAVLPLGMPLGDVIRTATENPARALKRGDLGTFRKGAAGDASILTLETGRFDYVDSTGEHLEGEKRLTANGVIIGGAVFAA
jgi:dihydroorotase